MDIHACTRIKGIGEGSSSAKQHIIDYTVINIMSVEMLRTGFFITGTFMCDEKRLQIVLQAMITPEDILLREMMFLNSRFGIIKSCSNKGFKAYTICGIRIRNK